MKTYNYNPGLNLYSSKYKLIARGYTLKKPVEGWWKTYEWMDMDCQTILMPGTKVDVFFSETKNEYLIGKVEERKVLGIDRVVTFEAFVSAK